MLCCLLCQRRLDIFMVKSIPEHLGICWRDTGELRAAPDVCDARSVAFPCSGSKQGQVILTTCMCYGNFWTDDPDPLSLLLGRCERLTCALLVGHLLQKCHKALSSSKLIWRAKSQSYLHYLAFRSEMPRGSHTPTASSSLTHQGLCLQTALRLCRVLCFLAHNTDVTCA